MMGKRVYDPWGEMLTEYGRFRLYVFIAREHHGHSGYKFISYSQTASALGLDLNESTRHAIEMGVWSLSGDRRGGFSLILAKRNKRGGSLHGGYTALLRVKPERLRERGFTQFADMYDACRR